MANSLLRFAKKKTTVGTNKKNSTNTQLELKKNLPLTKNTTYKVQTLHNLILTTSPAAFSFSCLFVQGQKKTTSNPIGLLTREMLTLL